MLIPRGAIRVAALAMKKTLIGAVALLACLAAHAGDCYTYAGSPAQGQYPSEEALKTAILTIAQKTGWTMWGPGYPTQWSGSGSASQVWRFVRVSPPQSGSDVSPEYTVYRTQGQCNPCEGNDTRTWKVRTGGARYLARSDGALWATADGRGYMGPVGPLSSPPDYICDGQCQWVSSGSPGIEWYALDPNAQGVHDVSREQTYMKTATQCTAKTESIDPTASPIQCDGYVGDVNGRTQCVAKESPKGIGSGKGLADNTPNGTPSVGSGTPTTVKNADGSPAKVGPNGEIPEKAGDRVGLGDLSGTGKGITSGPTSSTPGTGSGTGTTGTGTTTGTASGSTGTSTQSAEQCGARGQVACKIDESGTPDGSGAYDTAEASIGTETDKAKTAVGDAKNVVSPSWTWSFSLPTGCAPIEMPAYGFSLNMCAYQPMIHDIMSMVWLTATVFLCVGMVHKTATKG